MSGKESTEQAVLDALGAQPDASTTEVAEAAGIGRSSAAKQMAALERGGKVTPVPAAERAAGGFPIAG